MEYEQFRERKQKDSEGKKFFLFLFSVAVEVILFKAAVADELASASAEGVDSNGVSELQGTRFDPGVQLMFSYISLDFFWVL